LAADDRGSLLLRHDVDRLPGNSLKFAQLQQSEGLKGTFYFRIVPQSFHPAIIERVSELGHEIGYHYEDIDLVYKERKKKDRGQKIELKSLLDDAIESFDRNLETLRRFCPVKTICMHGSPLSPFDNKALWTKYDYRDFGIIGEPYFDIDFNAVAYYTDTGRRWDGENVSVRDKIDRKADDDKSARAKHQSKKENEAHTFPQFHSTHDMINAISKGIFPRIAMLTFHPQRWTNNPLLWTKELLGQRSKNLIKKYLFVK
jgi:hypothetical protein